MKQGSRSLIALALMVSIGTGSILFALPEKAEADASSCLAGILASKLKSTTTTTAAASAAAAKQAAAQETVSAMAALSVPTNDLATQLMVSTGALGNTLVTTAGSEISSDSAAQNTGFTIQRCIVEPLVTVMARALLSNFTAQTVKWINSGFKGSPLYVTNLQGFMKDVGDQTVGSFIEGLGPIGKILCSPFDMQIRLALNLQYSSTYVQEIGCRLTDIQQNVQRAFTGGSFGKNGWNNWLQLTAQPQNNIYGAYLKAVDTVDNQIASKINDQIKKLDWGRGFLSVSRCTHYENASNIGTGEGTGQVCTKSEITTPGVVIEDQLNKTLAQPLQNVGLAKDIDAILGALVGQMINQVMGGLGGLAGASQSPSGGGQSAVDRGLSDNVDSVLIANRQAQNLPDGILGDMKPQAFCAAFRNNRYFLDKTNGLIKAKIGVVGIDGRVSYPDDTLYVSYKGAVPWTVTDYNAVVTYCKNVSVTSSVSDASREFVGDINDPAKTGGNITPPEPPEAPPQNKNLALHRTASQSADYGNSPQWSANQAVNSRKGDVRNAAVAVPDSAGSIWWEVMLAENSTIETIKIYRRAGETLSESLGDSVIKILDKDKRPVGENIKITLSETTPITITVTPTRVGRYIRIERTGGRQLELDEVEVYAPEQVSAGGNKTSTISFEPAEAPQIKPNVAPPGFYNKTNRDFSNTFTLSASKSESGLKARLKFFRVPATGADQPTQFTTVFVAGSLAISGTPIDTSGSSAVFNPDFSLAKGDSFAHTETGMIADTAVLSGSDYPLYKLVEEIYKVTGGKDEVLATQTTTFKIQ